MRLTRRQLVHRIAAACAVAFLPFELWRQRGPAIEEVNDEGVLTMTLDEYCQSIHRFYSLTGVGQEINIVDGTGKVKIIVGMRKRRYFADTEPDLIAILRQEEREKGAEG